MPAPYSYNTTVASGSTDVVSVPFPYLARADVHILINTQAVGDDTLTWTSDSTIQLASTPTIGDVIKVYRDTPKDILAVDWSSPNVMAEADIERAFTQLLYIAQEAYDLGILPQIELDAAIAYVNQAVNNAQASADAASATKTAAETELEGYVSAAAASAVSAQNSADAAALIAEFEPSDYFQAANLFSEITGDTDKATARSNIGAIAASDVVTTAVRYDAAQALDSTQQATARGNIGAFPSVGGTVSGALTATGKITGTMIEASNGVLYTLGYSGNAGSGVISFGNSGQRTLSYGAAGSGGDYYVFANAHVYSLAGRLWGSNDFSLSQLGGGTTSMRWIYGGLRSGYVTGDASPYVLSGLNDPGTTPASMYLRYLQYYINGTWYTVGFA